MSLTQATEQWLQDLFTSIDNKDTENFSRFLGRDVEFCFGNTPTIKGKTAVTEQVCAFFDSIKALKHSVNEFWLKDETIICHGSVTYTRHNDRTLSVPFCNVFKTNQQGIYKYLIFADISELYQAE